MASQFLSSAFTAVASNSQLFATFEHCRNYNKNKADCLKCHKNKATVYALHCVLSTAEEHPLRGFKLGSWPCPVRSLRGG